MYTVQRLQHARMVTLGGYGKKAYRFVVDKAGEVWAKSNHSDSYTRLQHASCEMQRRWNVSVSNQGATL
jgi:hypothetical protein